MRLIDADKLVRVDHIILESEVDNAPTISTDKGVKIIWSAQIDKIVEKITAKRDEVLHDDEDYSPNDVLDVIDGIIKILEEAKGRE